MGAEYTGRGENSAQQIHYKVQYQPWDLTPGSRHLVFGMSCSISRLWGLYLKTHPKSVRADNETKLLCSLGHKIRRLHLPQNPKWIVLQFFGNRPDWLAETEAS